MERASAKPISRGAVLSPNAKQQCKMKILAQPNQDLHPAIFQMTKVFFFKKIHLLLSYLCFFFPLFIFYFFTFLGETPNIMLPIKLCFCCLALVYKNNHHRRPTLFPPKYSIRSKINWNIYV